MSEIGHELEHALTAQPRMLADLAELVAQREAVQDKHHELTQQLLVIHRQIDAVKAKCQHTKLDGSCALYPKERVTGWVECRICGRRVDPAPWNAGKQR